MWTTSWSALIANGLNATHFELIREGVMAYLVISLLAPLGWMFAVEICRRLRPCLPKTGDQKPWETTPTVAFQIAGIRQPASHNWGVEGSYER